jgi:hypothetical protein
MLTVNEANYLGDLRFELVFSNGRHGSLSVRPLLGYAQGLFSGLADEAFASKFKLAHGTLSWPGDLDVAPEYLYFLAFADDPAEQQRFQSWGYLTTEMRLP